MPVKEPYVCFSIVFFVSAAYIALARIFKVEEVMEKMGTEGSKYVGILSLIISILLYVESGENDNGP